MEKTVVSFVDGLTRYVFFTGKGGVGKTSLACAAGVALADKGRRVLLVSTDPASNLEQVLESKISADISPIEGVDGLYAVNIDPEEAAEKYRRRTIDSVSETLSEDKIAQLREQLSGACTTEIASFDQFTAFISEDDTSQRFDHIIFDTAPTGHTLRLLELPAAWSRFIDDNPEGASCLGPVSALESQKSQYLRAVEILGNSQKTTLVMVTRPEKSSIAEAYRSGKELKEQGIKNQILVINGIFTPRNRKDPLSLSIQKFQNEALKSMPGFLKSLPGYEIPLKSYNLVGISTIRKFLREKEEKLPRKKPRILNKVDIPPINELIEQLSQKDRGLIMVMGKGGVGKTTIAIMIAFALAERGLPVHLSTTDPAGSFETRDIHSDKIETSRIDPKLETQKYIENVMKTRGKNLSEDQRRLLREDLESPCTEEVAVFNAFSRIIRKAARGFVVLDTAPTGHTLLLLDRTGSYHTEILKKLNPSVKNITTPLMRLRDPEYSKILIVTLPETTPVLEASNLQSDLRRAGIEPYAWVINRSLNAADPSDPLLLLRANQESSVISRVKNELAKKSYIIPWLPGNPENYSNILKVTKG